MPVESRVVDPGFCKVPLYVSLKQSWPCSFVRKVEALSGATANGHDCQVLVELRGWIGTAKPQRVSRLCDHIIDFAVQLIPDNRLVVSWE